MSWFNGSHTAAVADGSPVMSVDDETTIWEVFLFSFFSLKVLQRRNDFVISQTDA